MMYNILYIYIHIGINGIDRYINICICIYIYIYVYIYIYIYIYIIAAYLCYFLIDSGSIR